MVSVTDGSTLSNPFATTSASMAQSPARSFASSDEPSDADPPMPAPAAVVQMVNICSHVPILLDLHDSNYSQWRCLFDSVLGKFGLDDHVCFPTPMIQRTAEWRQIDSALVNWIYTTISKPIFDLCNTPVLILVLVSYLIANHDLVMSFA